MTKITHNAQTATTTGDGICVEGLCDIGISITSAGVSSGTGAIAVDVSNDGTNWETSVAFVDPTQTAHQTYVTSLTTSGNADTKFAYLGADFSAKYIRVNLTVTTDGNYTVIVFADKR